MKKAIEGKFYLEAITIQESIITDRLLNFIIRNKILEITEEELHKPKAYLNNLVNHSKIYFDDELIYEELNAFRFGRNNCIHAIVKSFPGKPTINVNDFLKLAKETSINGKLLCRKIDSWHRRTKNKSLSLNKKIS